MGGHGGLNILPQKRWNVYNRDNRLKVARDEAKYEAEQQITRDKHDAAEREHRHQIMLQRARERHGGRANVLITEDGHAELPSALPLDSQQRIEEDTAAFTNHAKLTSHHDDNDDERKGEQVDDPMAALEAGNFDSTYKHPETKQNRATKRSKVDTTSFNNKKRQSSQSTEQLNEEEQLHPQAKHVRSSRGGRAPSLADLARNLDSQQQRHQEESQQPVLQEEEEENQQQLAEWAVQHRETNQPLQHINLFADEERKAKNPETEAEKREEKRKRGNIDTQTSDARFDAQFQFAHGLTGRGSVPWYAAARLPSHSNNTTNEVVLHASHQKHRHGAAAAKLDEWRKQGTAALAASATVDDIIPLKGNNNTGVIEAADIIPRDREPDTTKNEKSDGNTSSSESEDSRERQRRKKKKKSTDSSKKHHRDRSRDRKRSSKKAKKWEKEILKKAEQDLKAAEKAAMIAKLREERVQREQEEQRRQRAVLMSNGQGAESLPRYNAAYGYGRQKRR